jgi:hypothetical protein
MNNNVENFVERQFAKKRSIVNGRRIFKFFGAMDFYKRDNVHHNFFWEDLGLLIVKKHLPIQFVKSMWLKHLVL